MDADRDPDDIPISFDLSVEEFRALFADAEPPTDDDVPFRFRTRTWLKDPRPAD